ncbi:uncharacterized protein LOC114730107 [Neltuma alba]|uniref:uncharacterized protein LOC114723739 n=1 Tax=Neltuma alba TaxID=207710 RepID=UPI0010A457C6|nr:uncharacterized protein LOC114723739 [Prosopis alba]XP_028772965.1 uncharacterized protein LOC114730107 [Prosopis alba]
MKPAFSFVFILSLLLLVSSPSHARKDLEAYWEKKMKGLPMPELIKDLVLQDQPSVSDADKDLFVKDFDVKPNVIIYHSHHVESHQDEKKMKDKAFGEKLEEEKLAQ